MNLKLTESSAISRVSGRSILRAILRDTRGEVARCRDKQWSQRAQIAQALTGSYREEHLFELKLAYEAWQFTLGQVAKVDEQIALQLGRMKCDRALPPLKPSASKRQVNSPGFDVRTALCYVVGLDLTEIEGISELTALTLIGEIGPGVKFDGEKFCSWLGLCAPTGRRPGASSRAAPPGEPRGAGVASGGAESAPQPGGHGRVSAADERAAGGDGGGDGDGAQTGADRLSGVEVRPDVRAEEPGGIRRSDEGEAGQGVEAEGAPVGPGGDREDAGRRTAEQHRCGDKGGTQQPKRWTGGRRDRGRENSPSNRFVALAGKCAPEETRNKILSALSPLAEEVPCNRRAQRLDSEQVLLRPQGSISMGLFGP